MWRACWDNIYSRQTNLAAFTCLCGLVTAETDACINPHIQKTMDVFPSEPQQSHFVTERCAQAWLPWWETSKRDRLGRRILTLHNKTDLKSHSQPVMDIMVIAELWWDSLSAIKSARLEAFFTFTIKCWKAMTKRGTFMSSFYPTQHPLQLTQTH